MSKLQYEIALVLGDWSDDGHGKTEIITIRSNLDHVAVDEAYDEGSKKLGFNFADTVCVDYEDSSISVDDMKRLMDHGLTLEELFKYKYDLTEAKKALENAEQSTIGLYADAFAAIYLFIAKLGNSQLEYKVVNEHSRINIGGYGLFGS